MLRSQKRRLATAGVDAAQLPGVFVTDKPLIGIALLLAATVFFSLSDAMAKSLVDTLPAIEIAWVRYLVFTSAALVWIVRQPAGARRTRRPGLQVVRGISVVGSALCFILALGSLPLAEASAVNFASPLFITVLAIPFLGELVDARAWLAVLAGFGGVLIVVRPGTAGFHPGTMLVVASCLLWAIGMIVSRRMGAAGRPAVTLAWTALTGLALLTVLVPFVWVPLGAAQVGRLIVLGVVASSAQFCVVAAYRLGPASVLAPISYCQLIWSALLSWRVFGAAPDAPTIAGALVIVAGSLYSMRRARARTRAIAAHAARMAHAD
jgi:drug/metabolite transporter (DMT)-like permease